MTQPYEPPESTSDGPVDRESTALVPGRIAIWAITGIAFCFGAAWLFGAWVFWRTPEFLTGLSGFTYYYYALRPIVLAVGFFGLSWKCLRYVDAVTHNVMDSSEVRLAHGDVWNWMAVMLAAFVILVAYHSLGG